jgi:hypothetical protein
MRENRSQPRSGDLYDTARMGRMRQVRIANHDVLSRNAQELEDERFCRFLGDTCMTCLPRPLRASHLERYPSMSPLVRVHNRIGIALGTTALSSPGRCPGEGVAACKEVRFGIEHAASRRNHRRSATPPPCNGV